MKTVNTDDTVKVWDILVRFTHWAVAGGLAINLWHEINETNDSQITQVAHYLLVINRHQSLNKQAFEHQYHHHQNIEYLDDIEDDAMGFAIWDSTGKQIMSDANGKNFEFLPKYDDFSYGFVDDALPIYQRLNPFNRQWRLFFIQDDRTDHIIAVGQNLHNRQEMIVESLGTQLLPMLIGLMLLTGWTIWQVHRGLSPLRDISQQLSHRHPKDTTPLALSSQQIPSEVMPLVTALNEHFLQTALVLKRESQFTADASHELRSPLTALRLHAELMDDQLNALGIQQSTSLSMSTAEPTVTLTDDDVQSLLHHGAYLKLGIERMQNLIEQLLILTKLDPKEQLSADEMHPIDWLTVTETVLSDSNIDARRKSIRLKRELTTNADSVLPLTGNTTLLTLLLRNLIDNAIRYSPENSTVTLTLAHDFMKFVTTEAAYLMMRWHG